MNDDRVHAAVTRAPLDIGACQARVARSGAGAVLTFVGTVRDEKQGRSVLYIDYEAYEPMAEKVLGRIGAEMCARWPTCAAALEHRIGRVEVGEPSIVIVVSTPHRAEGFEALRYGIEAVKHDLPVWKKEYFADGAVWVQEGS